MKKMKPTRIWAAVANDNGDVYDVNTYRSPLESEYADRIASGTVRLQWAKVVNLPKPKRRQK